MARRNPFPSKRPLAKGLFTEKTSSNGPHPDLVKYAQKPAPTKPGKMRNMKGGYKHGE